MGFWRGVLGPSAAEVARLRERERLDRRSWVLDWLEDAEFRGRELQDGTDERCLRLADDMLDQGWDAFDVALQAEIMRSRL